MTPAERVPLVLLPGLDGTGRLFDPLLGALPDWIEPIVVSYPVDERGGYGELREIVSAALPVDREFLILGESFSGPLAIMSAGDRPQGLKGIILCASFARNPFKLLPSWLGHFSVGPIFRLWPATIRLRAMIAPDQYAGLVEQALDAIDSVSPAVIAERVKAVLDVNVERELAAADVPILYLAGRRDRLIRPHNVTGIRRLRPDTTVAEIDTLHFVLQLEPERSAEEIARFIGTIAVAASGH